MKIQLKIVKNVLFAMGCFFFFLFENIQTSGQQTNKMLHDIGSKAHTEKQLMREANSSQFFCILVGFGFAISPPPQRLLS